MAVTPLADRRTGAEEPDPTWVRQAEPLAGQDAEAGEQAVRALMGACLLGALDHVGASDLRRWNVANRSEVTLAQLRPVFVRGDDGLHGCGFEYAVHAAINGSSAIPMTVRDTVLTAVSGQVQLILHNLGVPTDGWNNGLRSVMYGVERRGRPEQMDALKAALGQQALLWPHAGAAPVRLLDVLPLARCLPLSTAGHRRTHSDERPRLPENLSCLWRTDLLLGGASVLPTGEVQAVVGDPPYNASAWVSASLKYRSRQVTAGAGLHLGIETAFTRSGRRPLAAAIREVQGLPVVTLPLDGEFLRAFNRANASLRLLMRSGLARHLHPADATDCEIELYGSWFGARRTLPVVEVADELLAADPHLFAFGNRPASEAVALIAGRELEERPRRRPLAAVPQLQAS